MPDTSAVIWLAAFGGPAYLFAERVPLLAIIAFIIGIGAPCPLLRLVRLVDGTVKMFTRARR